MSKKDKIKCQKAIDQTGNAHLHNWQSDLDETGVIGCARDLSSLLLTLNSSHYAKNQLTNQARAILATNGRILMPFAPLDSTLKIKSYSNASHNITHKFSNIHKITKPSKVQGHFLKEKIRFSKICGYSLCTPFLRYIFLNFNQFHKKLNHYILKSQKQHFYPKKYRQIKKNKNP